jgi:glycosyltransferase involved in cell wall biosynthesis
VAISAMRRAGIEVAERNEAVWETAAENWRGGFRVAARLARAELRLLRRPPENRCDALVVAYPGQLDLPAARRAARGGPVVFDPLVSAWDTQVADRGRFREGSLAARALAAVDRRALRAADLVVADTAANGRFLRALGRLPEDRVRVCFVGAEERLFRPRTRAPEDFTVLFVGKLIPLHGVETVLAAARLAPELHFRIVGSGQLEGVLSDPPSNLERVPWVDYELLPGELAQAGCALGVFGTSRKASRVIPNKAFQALACAVPLVTADTPAARELLVDGESALLVPPGDPAALAAALRRLAVDQALRERLAAAGHRAFRIHAGEEVLGRRWRTLLEDVVRR